MLKEIKAKFKVITDRFLMRTKPMGSMNQIHWGMELASDIYADALNKGRSIGVVLYEYLPPTLAPFVIRTWFDPYGDYTIKARKQIRDWLWDHVMFDDMGNIIAIHDRGEVFTCQIGWECEVDWLSRIRMSQRDD